MRSMDSYPKAAMERAMKVQDVMLQAMAKRITCWQAAEILGIRDRYMRAGRARFQAVGYNELVVILDDATGEIYYAQLVEEESTATVMAGLKEVIERKGVFCALYSDRGSHFWLTPKVGGKVDYQRRTQVGRALHELGVQMI